MRQARTSLLSIFAISGSLFCLTPTCGAAPAQSSYANEILKDVREDKVYLLENIRRKLTKPSEKMVVEALLTEDGPKAAGLYRKQLAEYPDPQLDAVSRSRLAAYERAVAANARPVMNAPKPVAQAPRATPIQPPASAAKKADSVSRKPTAPAVARPATAASTVTLPAAKKPDSVAQQSHAPAMKPVQPATAPVQPSTPRVPSQAAPKLLPAGTFTLQFGSFDSVTNADLLASQVSSSSPASVVQMGDVYKVRLKKTFATRDEAAAFARKLPLESFVVTVQP